MLWFIATSLSLAILVSGEDYLWDLNNDPIESNNLVDDSEYMEMVASMTERLVYWQSQLVDGDDEDSSTEDKNDVFESCGGICAYVDNTYSMDIDQKYFPENPPNIMFILVDDWGWNDIGFRSTYMNWTTPTIDNLVSEGVLLQNYFTHSFCVPSRGAFLTGRFAGRLGMLEDKDGYELPLSEVTIAQEMKSAGYRTHMVGKWHMGDSSLARSPTYRGFDSFYGYYEGFMDYYKKSYGAYLDLHDGNDLVQNQEELSEDVHAAFLFQDKVEAVIANHVSEYASIPLFVFYSMQLMHFPYEAPITYKERCNGFGTSDFSNDAIYCAMSLILDEAIANLTCVLKQYDIVDNTVIFVASDNGGEDSVSGDSVPFRGHKYDFNRGGIGATAFIVSELIPETMRGTSYYGQMHVTDWLPTLMSLATEGAWNGSYTGAVIDGVDMWGAILNNSSSPRLEIPHYANQKGGSIQIDMMKLDINLTLTDYDNVTDFYPMDLAPQYSWMLCEDPEIASVIVNSVDPISPAATSATLFIWLGVIVGFLSMGFVVILQLIQHPSRKGYEVVAAEA